MMKVDFKTKYTTVTVNEDASDGKMFYWATVDLAWTAVADPRAKAFGLLMDHRLVEEARKALAPAVENPEKDIYLEDVSLLVNLAASKRQYAIALVDVVKKLELEFDSISKESA